MLEPLASKNSQRFTELFLEIERRVDVNAIAIDGVQLWPLIRARLRKPFKALSAVSEPEAANTQAAFGAKPAAAQMPVEAAPATKMPRWSDRLRALFSGESRSNIVTAAPPPSRRPEPVHQPSLRPEDIAAQMDAQIARIAKAGPVDFVILSRPVKYYQKLGGKYYAPILDPVYEDLAERGRALMLCECTELGFECLNPPVLFDSAPQAKLRRYLPPADRGDVLARMAEIQAVVAELEPEFSFEPRKVLTRYNGHFVRKQLFVRLFKALAPRAVFFSSFTGWVPVIWACRELGIPTIDIQHGGQTTHHGFNTHYSRVPAHGYWLLPDFFWCWGAQNRDIVARWFPGGANRHFAVVGGNRWKAKWLGESARNMLSAAQLEYLDGLAARHPAILVTLSHGVDELLPQCLLDAMEQRRDWFWLIRMHPINRDKVVEGRLRARLAERGLDNFEIDNATDIPLHALLQRVHYHLSPFSTASREAVDFGVPTTIIDPIGKVDLADDIAAGRFTYADDVDSLCACIEEGLAMGGGGSESLLETDDALVDDTLRQIEVWRLSGAAEAR